MPRIRRNEISCLNVLFCLLVVFIHVISPTVNVLTQNTIGYNLAMFPWRAISFVVPGFVLLSGVKLFLTGKDSKGYFSYLKSRFLGVVFPYLIACAVYYAFLRFSYGPSWYPLKWDFILDQVLYGTLVYHLYFIVLLVQFDLLFPLWKLIINKCSPMLVVPFCLVLTVVFEKWSPEMIRIAQPSVERLMPDRMVMTYIGYWILGCYIGKYYDKFVELLKNSFKTVCTIFAICFSLFAYYTYLAFNGLEWVQFTNEIHTLYTMAVLVFLYALAVKIKCALPKVVTFIDRASFDIYLYHVLFLYLAEYVLGKFEITNTASAFGVRVLFGYGVTIPLCVAKSVLMGKIKNKFNNEKTTSA